MKWYSTLNVIITLKIWQINKTKVIKTIKIYEAITSIWNVVFYKYNIGDIFTDFLGKYWAINETLMQSFPTNVSEMAFISADM